MTRPGSWVQAILAAGAVPASHVPEASLGRIDIEEFTGADPVEDRDLRVHPLAGARALTRARSSSWTASSSGGLWDTRA
jgi:hypothetical protein